MLPVLAAVGSAIGNVASSILTNNTNKKISRETNEQNYKIWQEQLAAQREQYEREKQENRFLVQQQRDWSLADRDFENNYNDPSNVRKRLIDAGINPAFAMSNGQGLFGSSTAETSTGSPPSSSIPVAPEMRGYTADYSGFGRGISDAAALYYQSKQEQRADYSLASDITFRDRKSYIDFMNAISEAKKAGLSERQLDHLIDKFNKEYALERDKFEAQKSLDDDTIALQRERVVIERLNVQIQDDLARQNIRLSKTQINSIRQDIEESAERIEQMRKNGASERDLRDAQKKEAESLKRLYQRQRINLENTDIRDWLKLYLESNPSLAGSRFSSPVLQYEIQQGYLKSKNRRGF